MPIHMVVHSTATLLKSGGKENWTHTFNMYVVVLATVYLILIIAHARMRDTTGLLGQSVIIV